MRRIHGFRWALAIPLLVLLAAPRPLSPALIVVDGGCSLADAIASANSDSPVGSCAAGSGADQLELTSDVTLLAALPVVASEITIQGSGFAVARDDAAPAFRIFEVGNGVLFSIDNTTVSNGDAGSGGGGAVLVPPTSALMLTNSTLSGNTADRGGALYSNFYGAQITLIDSTVSGNSARVGGGIWDYGYLTLVNSSVTGNSATTSGGGIHGRHLVSVTESSRISGNTALGAGGGIELDGYGVAGISNSTVSDNIAGGSGGGIYMANDFGSLDYQSISIIESTLSGNTSGGDGGGVRLHGGSYQGGYMKIVNSTISGNTATRGGGIHHADGSLFTLDNSTISGNSAIVGGAVYGAAAFSSAPVFTGSILADSQGGANCEGGQITADATNFDDDGTCDLANPITPGIDFDTDLADHGGPTMTHALLPGSVAIDAGGDCIWTTDQRGFSRNNGPCDSGSVEFGLGLLSLTGECPGTMRVRALRAAPDSLMEVFLGPAAGSSQVPSGVCAGTELGITSPTSVALISTDASGDGSAMVDFVAADCGQLLQGVVEAGCGTSNLESIDSCDLLALSHTGAGASPAATPTSSPGCSAKEYLPGEAVSLLAAPDPSWAVGSWTGTDDDASTDLLNTVTMPVHDHAAAVNYLQACRSLTVTRNGDGRVPEVSPLNSPGCADGEYFQGELIQLSNAQPKIDWAIDSWTGTDDDASTASSNTVTMPATDHTAAVNYVKVCFVLGPMHSGSGADPVASPPGSAGCSAVAYRAGDLIDLTAAPDTGWEVIGWSGTDDDSSTSTTNTLTMPAAARIVRVDYAAICYSLTLGHTGQGADPTAVPLANGASSAWASDLTGNGTIDLVGAGELENQISWWEGVYGGVCPPGEFNAGDRLTLTAAPAAGWEVAGWSGTDDDASTETTNITTMPAADHAASVHYVESTGSDILVSTSGVCPGEVEVSVTTAEPLQDIILFVGGHGTSVIPAGACAGSELDLATPRQWRTLSTDGNGQDTFSRTLDARWCGRSIQALDRSCGTSNVAQLP